MKNPAHSKKWRLIDVLKEAIAFLRTKGVENPRLHAEQLLSHALKVSRIDLYLRFEQPLGQEERNTFKALLRRRAVHEPLQYIVGEAEFMSLPFKLTPSVMIPRPETEVLVEKAIEEITKAFGAEKEVTCLDIGTGCGNVAISLAHDLNPLRVWAVDVDEESLAVARENAELNGVNDVVHFLKLDAAREDFTQQLDRRFDVVVSNPPYVSEAEYSQLPEEIRRFEPKLALDGGVDGLRFYRTLGNSIPAVLKDSGLVLMEIGADQAEGVMKIFTKIFSWKTQIFRDLAGRDRVLFLSR